MLANAFLREFTSSAIPSDFLDQDPAVLFPWNPCPDGVLPSDGNFCWIDYRDEGVKSNNNLCSVNDTGSSNGNGGGNGGDSSSAGRRISMRQGVALSLVTFMGAILSI